MDLFATYAKSSAYGLFMVLVSLCLGLCLGFNQVSEAKLVWRDFAADNINLPESMSMSFGLHKVGFTPINHTVPAGVIDARFFSTLEGDPEKRMGVLGKSKKGGPVDQLYIDWNDDRQFDPSEKARLEAVPTPTKLPNLSFLADLKPVSEGVGPIHARIIVTNNEYVTIQPTGYMSGTLQFDGQSRQVGFIDADCDGTYNCQSQSVLNDWVAFDRNANGKLDLYEKANLSSAKEHWIGIVTAQVGEEKFGKFSVAPDGSSVKFLPDSRAVGKLIVKGVDQGVLNASEKNGFVEPEIRSGIASVPVGSYSLYSARVSRQDQLGRRWFYDLRPIRDYPFRISDTQPNELKLGYPIKASLVESQYARTISLVLALQDTNGFGVSRLTDSNQKEPSLPTVLIYDSKGRKVTTERMGFG